MAYKRKGVIRVRYIYLNVFFLPVVSTGRYILSFIRLISRLVKATS